MRESDLLVIGAGVTGLAAARRALSLGVSTAVMECLMFGGLVINVNQLDGELKGSGADLASSLMDGVLGLGGESLSATAVSIARQEDRFVVETDGGPHRARAVIVASGARLKRLGVPGESELEHKGVSRCADCDGPFYAGHDVAVIGGGDSALQSALVLAAQCRTVHLVHRGERFRARPHFAEAVAARPNIRVHWGCEVERIVGTDAVSALRVRTAAGSADIACAGVFPYIGLEPASEFVPPGLARDAAGFLVTDPQLRTAIAGLFAAGAIRSGCGGLLTDAFADGEAAAGEAERLLRT